MPRKTNGRTSMAGHKGVGGAASLTAVQELIGLIHYREADVTRFELGDYDLYLFAVKRPPTQYAKTLPKEAPRKIIRSSCSQASTLTGPPRALFDKLIEAACRQTRVTPDELASKTRSKPLSLARALVAYYANLTSTASYALSASLLGLHPNSLHMSVRRYRKVFPQLFAMSAEQFLALRESPEQELFGILGETWAEAGPESVGTDAKLGSRIARALAFDEGAHR
jgi:hypothetical protein